MNPVNFNTHSFSPYLAEIYGWKDAVFLQHIYYWVKHNKGKGANFHDGNWWTYNTRKGFSEYFRYLTEDDIRGVIDRLKKKNMLITGNYNKISWDKTTWYALTEFSWQLFGDTIGEIPQSKGEETKSDGEIPESKKGNSPDNTNSKTSITHFSLSEMENFWKELKEREKFSFEIDVKKFYDWCIDEGNLKRSWKNIMKSWANDPRNQVKKSVVKKSFTTERESPEITKTRDKIKLTLDNNWQYFMDHKIEGDTIYVTDKRALKYEADLEKIGIKIELK